MNTTNYDVIFMVGSQGSGKGTQGKRLAAKLGFFFWDMGAELRRLITEKGSLAEKISVINKGTLLPDEIIVEVLKERLPALPKGEGVVFDGLPRRISQAEFIIDLMRAEGRARMASVCINIPREEAIKRILKRAETEGRIDDVPEAIHRRFDAYDQLVVPMLEYMKTETYYVEIDGTPSPDEVEKEVDKALGVA